MDLSHDKAVAQQTQAKKPNTSHEEERIALILLAMVLSYVIFFDETRKMKPQFHFSC